MGIIAFFETRLGAYTLVGLMLLMMAGAIALHMKLTADKITSLTQQVTLLKFQVTTMKAMNDALKEDIANVAAVQTSTNVNLSNIRDQASLDEQALRNSPPGSAAQINKHWADSFKRLENVSRAP